MGWLGKAGRVYFTLALARAALMTCSIMLRAPPYRPLSAAAAYTQVMLPGSMRSCVAAMHLIPRAQQQVVLLVKWLAFEHYAHYRHTQT